MEVTGKLVKKLELETGTSKAGKEWQKQSIVIDTGKIGRASCRERV